MQPPTSQHGPGGGSGGAGGPGAPGPAGTASQGPSPPPASLAPLTIAIDAMGGDNAPDEIVRAAAALSLERPRGFHGKEGAKDGESSRPLNLLLVGDAAKLSGLLYELRHDAERIAIHHAPEFITMDESPRTGLDNKPEASIAVAARLCAAGHADALVSAGNTGAAVLACQRYWKRLEGVKRCALAAVYPTEVRRGEKEDPFSLLLDVGATLDVTADDLCAFAIMGAGYAARISKNPRPRVALLSNGGEAGKGPREVVEAHARLAKMPNIHFIGNVEGVDIPRGTADVVVCGGFVGNIVLKMLEGVSETVVRLASYAYKEKLMWRAGLAMLSGGIGRLKDLTDWKQYGGAPLLGFDRLLIKAHGRSPAHAVQNAIKVAAKTVNTGLVPDISRALTELPKEPVRDGSKPAPEPVSS